MQADTAVHGVPPMPTGKEAASEQKEVEGVVGRFCGRLLRGDILCPHGVSRKTLIKTKIVHVSRTKCPVAKTILAIAEILT